MSIKVLAIVDKTVKQWHFCLSACRTVTQEDPGDNQVTLEEITQMVRERLQKLF